MATKERPFALVTGASSGIGLELERADMMDTKVSTQKKQSANEVAKIGFEAMMRGDGDVVAGWNNKLRAAIAHIMPAAVLAARHRGMAAP